MAQKNQISAAITETDKEEVLSSINALRNKLAPVIPFSLTADERQAMSKMGDKTLAFVEKAMEYAHQYPQLAPSFMDIPEADKDFRLSRDLYEILQAIRPLTRAIEDAMMVTGSEAYEASLMLYGSVKSASRGNIPGSQAIYEDLHKRFPRRLKKDYTDASNK